MTVVLTEQIKLTFPSKKERIFADQAFSKVTKRYADACTYVSEYFLPGWVCGFCSKPAEFAVQGCTIYVWIKIPNDYFCI